MRTVPRLEEVRSPFVTLANREKGTREFRIPLVESDGGAKRDPRTSLRMSRPLLLGSTLDAGLVGAPQPEQTISRDEFGRLLKISGFKGALLKGQITWSPADGPDDLTIGQA